MLVSWFHNIGQGVAVPVRSSFTHASLLRLLVKRDIVNRSSGTFLGKLWPLLQPALQVLGFWFLFDIVYGMRLDRDANFVQYLLTGMLPWLCLTEVLNRSASMFREFSSLFRRTPFPIEILPILIMVIPGLVYTLVYFLVGLLMYGPLAAVKGLIVIPLLLLWLLPLTFLFGVLGLFIRDFTQALPFVLMFAMYLTPILYFPSMLPESMQSLLWINPFADMMLLIHSLMAGTTLPWQSGVRLAVLWLLLLGPAWLLFKRSLPHIREVL